MSAARWSSRAAIGGDGGDRAAAGAGRARRSRTGGRDDRARRPHRSSEGRPGQGQRWRAARTEPARIRERRTANRGWSICFARRSRRGGRITFARFMERALTEPGLGYYASSDLRPTPAGDFVTSPELHPFFGRCIARQLDRGLGAARGTRPLHGPRVRRGTRDAGRDRGLRPACGSLGTARCPGLAGCRPAGRNSAAGRGQVQRGDRCERIPGRAPRAPRGRARGGALLERYVTWRDGWFAEEDGAGVHARARGAAGGRRRDPGRRAARGDLPRGATLGHRRGPRTWSAASAWCSTTATRPPSCTARGTWPEAS